MKKIFVLVEGQTEERFVKELLERHYSPSEIFLTPIIISTKILKSGKKFKGGVSTYEKMKSDLKNEKVNPRDLKMRLGRDIVSIYHSKKDAKKAEQNFKKVFQRHQAPDKIEIYKAKIKKINIIDLLVKSKLCIISYIK